jgi:rod shape-determining protein MreC
LPLHPKFPKWLTVLISIFLIIGTSFGLYFFYQKVLSELSYLRNLTTVRELKEENIRLRKMILHKELTNIQTNRILEENQELKKMLELKQNYQLELIAANLINTTPWKWDKTARIDKGSLSGIEKDSLVIDPKNNLVGRIITVEPDYSFIKLIFDPDFKIIAVCGGLKTIFVGSLFDGGKLLYVPQTAEINNGDVVSVNNVNGINIHINIGSVNYVRSLEGELTQTVLVRPFVNPSDISKVFILNNKK